MVSPCWTTNTKNASIITKNSLDKLPTFGPFSYCFSGDSSTIRRSKACLPPFLPWHPQRDNQRVHVPTRFRGVEVNMFFELHNWFRNLFLPLLLLKSRGSFNTFTSFTPFLCLRKEGFLSWALLCLDPPHPSPSSSSYIFVE